MPAKKCSSFGKSQKTEKSEQFTQHSDGAVNLAWLIERVIMFFTLHTDKRYVCGCVCARARVRACGVTTQWQGTHKACCVSTIHMGSVDLKD
jgi:hypothetical protein